MNLNRISFFRRVLDFLKKESVMTIAVILAVLSSFISSPKMEYIDFRVLILLFNLMIVVSAYRKLSVMDSIAVSILKKCNNSSTLSFALVFITFFSSMIITNDVALITFVPLSLITLEKAGINPIKTVVLQTIAANLGSCFTPIGNPQNLYIYSFYSVPSAEFFRITGVIILISAIVLAVVTLISDRNNLTVDIKPIYPSSKTDTIVFSALFIIILLSVFNVIDYKIVLLITILTVFIVDRSLFMKVDYALLITFIGFFIFIGNISAVPTVRDFMSSLLKTPESTFFTSIAMSQIISNVPATVLLSGFTDHFKELLLGVNIGGMGTLIASLASLISYKIYAAENNEETSAYMKKFTLYNIIGLLIFIPAVYFLAVHTIW
ncbi:SLC13 family permease [Peptacetobacter hominis]|uniref:SLC13 family permease n=1 Tax=Peptacetobacter hominis TaxID=2743610 RepID=UPI001FE37F0D|nr:SLC13 family permease [Peptacetobacter hominis]